MIRPATLKTVAACVVCFGAGYAGANLVRSKPTTAGHLPASAPVPAPEKVATAEARQKNKIPQAPLDSASTTCGTNPNTGCLSPVKRINLNDSIPEAQAHEATTHGLPVATDSRLIVTDAFVASFDGRSRNPRWVAERLNAQTVRGNASRKHIFFSEEKSIQPRFRNRLSHFRRSGFDRGHLAAAANHKHSQDAMRSTFTLANISPQVGVLLHGIMLELWHQCCFSLLLLALVALPELLRTLECCYRGPVSQSSLWVPSVAVPLSLVVAFWLF